MFEPNFYPMFDRRTLLKGALGAGLLTSGLPIVASSPVHAQFKQNPFSLGVASGDLRQTVSFSGPGWRRNRWRRAAVCPCFLSR
ncbi:MAG: hypothetical protein JWO28_1700 [Hyphomicrobiales bacterium]|nr:hypothetical protein [Hyphomicrobiales bacterium]